MLRRLAGKRQSNGLTPVQPNERSHGDHWRCIYPDLSSGQLRSSISQLVRDASAGVSTRDGVVIYRASESALTTVVLVRRRSVVAAFPASLHGPEWPVEISDIVPWRGGLEGQIRGSCMGAAISFYDTAFHANHDKYTVGDTYNFQMGAFAYVLGPAQDMEAESGQGVKVSFKGAHAYMPAGLGGPAADIDDYWFHSPLEKEPVQDHLNDILLTGYPIILALPNDFEMSLTLYAAPHVEAPGTQSLAPGADLQGYLWLQGCLSETLPAQT